MAKKRKIYAGYKSKKQWRIPMGVRDEAALGQGEGSQDEGW